LVVLDEVSNLLNTGLSKESLSICVQLLEEGADPEALATVVKELRREAHTLRESQVSESG
ncbi:MAG: mitotic-spindle organizing gamma-tubulin ring associated-domain-containing protein, partial [Piptocephalis tieghemiana]